MPGERGVLYRPLLTAPVVSQAGLGWLIDPDRHRGTSMASSIWSGTISFGHIEHFPHLTGQRCGPSYKRHGSPDWELPALVLSTSS
jgi:hypothetical protein